MNIVNLRPQQPKRGSPDMLAAGTITACAWHLNLVAAYMNETGRIEIAEVLNKTAGSLAGLAAVIQEQTPRCQPLHPRDIG
jgi:hypothetical protein